MLGVGSCFKSDSVGEEKWKTWRFADGWQNQPGWQEFRARFEPLKFYLAFENAYHCTDYISEKLWRNSFETGLVPVVYGPTKEDLLRHAPPNSFIFAEDFNSPRELVGYLDFLDENDGAYMDYHQWRTLIPDEKTAILKAKESSLPKTAELFCKMCNFVREAKKKKLKQTYKSVLKFWRFDVGEECKSQTRFPSYIPAIKQNVEKKVLN